MKWHLLNQHFVNLEFKNLGISVLEEVLSSELQLVQLLVSGSVSLETMTSHFHGLQSNSQELESDHFRVL